MLRGPATLAMLTALGCSTLPVVPRDASADGADTGDVAPCDATACGERCVDLGRDPAHCGACGNACAAGVDCIGGLCSRRVVQLSATLNHTCALTADGAVWCWGENQAGQCDGSLEVARPVPTRATVDVGVAVHAGWNVTCVTSADGRVRCWGENRGMLSAEAGGVLRAPVEVPLPRPAVALDACFALGALLDDGTVWCRPNFNRAPTLPHARWLDGAVALASGWGHLCALRDDGTVACGGRRGYGTLGDGDTTLAGMDYVDGAVRPVGLPRVAQLATSAEGNCARTADGAVWCWGQVYHDAGYPLRWSPTRIDDARGAREIWSLRHGYVFRRAGDDALYGWGDNPRGAVGDGTDSPRPTAVRLAALDAIARDVVSIAGGLEHTCALLRDGTVRCWGTNVAGQLGTGSLGGRSLTPVSPRW